MKYFFTILCLICLPTWVGADHLWTVPQGTFRTAFSITGALWDQFLQQGTQSVELPGEITQYEFSLYGEYAPIEHLSIDLTIPIVVSERKFVFLDTDPEGNIVGVQAYEGRIRDVDTNVGFGDITFGANYIFWDKYVSLGSRGFLKLPGSYNYGEIVNAPGDGQTDVGLALLVGALIPKARMYVRGSLGYTLRTGEPNNQLEVFLEPGVNITDRFSARFLYKHTEQFGGDDVVFYGKANFFPSNEEDADQIGFGLSYKATDLLGIFGLYQQTVAGRNTANTKAFTVGVDFTF